MVRGRRALLLMLLALGCAPAGAQEPTVHANVDRATIRENESFTYTIRVEGRTSGEPDVSFLEQQFDILTRSASTQIQLVNGRTQQVAEWIYQLMPRKAGTFMLPPLQFGNTLSNAVTIEVLPAPAAGDEPADVFMEVEIDPTSAYVQAQIIYTLKLFVGVNTGRATLTPPPVAGGEAIVERLGEDQQYQVVRNGRTFLVRERRFAIFPQQAGTLSIGPVTYEAMVIPSRGFSRVQRLRSDTIDVTVLPAVAPPPELAGASWLPATRVAISSRWGDDRTDFRLGVPRQRILTITADGLLETQLPDLDVGQASGLRQYRDQPELERDVGDAGLTGRRIERYAVLAQNVGDATLPAVELPWFNVRAGRWEVARLASESFAVAPNDEPDIAAPPVAVDAEPLEPGARAPNYWPFLSAGLSVAWIATILLWLRARRGRSPGRPRERVTAPVGGRSTGRLVRELRAACNVHDAGRTRDLLLTWGKVTFAQDPPANLGALRGRLPEALAAEVGALEAYLYGPDGGAWNGARLAELVGGLDTIKPAGADAEPDPLVPLYR